MSEPLDLELFRERMSRKDYSGKRSDIFGLLAEVERLRAELARRDEQIAAVRELHAATRVDRLGDICYECGGRSCPCPTIEALDGGAS